MKIEIVIGQTSLKGELFKTDCAIRIAAVLPLEVIPEEWGDEFYFTVPVTCALDETATTEVKVGDIGYWPPGRAVAIFFGPTPMSRGKEPVPASAVNLIGRIFDDVTILRREKGGKKLIIRTIAEV
ncbi:MAG: cyclophilin-like fold protein [Syntrophales bacterium]|nr:cyclophilin-like fold protein [Syntrophales bacterium]